MNLQAFLKNILFILIDRDYKWAERQAERERERRMLSREPDVGLDPRTLGS